MKEVKDMYSVVLLKESTIIELKNEDDTKCFEESIVLIDVTTEFFEKGSPAALLAYFIAEPP